MPRRTLPPELLALLQGGLSPVPDPLTGLLKKARKLPLDAGGVWLLLTHRLSTPALEAQGEGLTLVVLLDVTNSALLYQEMPEDVDTGDLTRLVLKTMLEPEPVTRGEDGRTITMHTAPHPLARPRQPARLLASDAYVAQSLAAELSALKVSVEHDDSPETAHKLLTLAAPYQATMDAQMEAMRGRPVLAGQPDDAVRAYHAAMSDFLRADPWEVFDPLKLVRAGWTDDQGTPGQCCATVMGGEGESFGLALFSRADEWAVLAQGHDPLTALGVLSGMERVLLSEASELAPEDLATFKRLGLEPIRWGGESGWPVLQRLSLNNAPQAQVGVQSIQPVTPLGAVTALLQTLADRAQAKPGRPVTSLTAEMGGVRVRYPSPPADDFSEQERRGAVRVTFDGAARGTMDAPQHLILTAPADMTLRDAWSKTERKHGRWLLPYSLEFPEVEEMHDEDGPFGSAPARLWHSRSGAPQLIMRHLSVVGTLDGGEGQVIRAEWLPGLEVPDIDLEVREASKAGAAPVNIPLYPEPVKSPIKKKPAKAAAQKAAPQKRAQHQGMCRLCGFVGNKASMTRHLAKCEKRPATGKTGAGKGEHEVYRMRVADSRSPVYWLDVEMPVTANLNDLDGFLRGIWLECCGHMSAFTVGPQEDDDDFDPFDWRPNKVKQPSLDKLGLAKGDKFGYTYDFGSSTDLNVQVQARETVAGKAKEKVRLLARNIPPALVCSECGEPAVWVNSWEYDEETGQPALYCAEHGEDQDEDGLLPVVNSPRMGVCGYEGGNLDDWPPVSAD